MDKIRQLLIVLLILPVLGLSLVSGYTGAGTQYFEFINSEYDAVSLSMGGADAAYYGNISGLLSNPAAPGFMERHEMMISYIPLVSELDIRNTFLGYGMTVGDINRFSVGVQYISDGVWGADILRDENNNPIEAEIHPYGISLNFGWAGRITRSLSYGTVLKGAYRHLASEDDFREYSDEYSASALLCDIGVQYRNPRNRYIYGFGIKNIGGILSDYEEGFKEASEYSMPVVLFAGVSGRIPRFKELLLSLNIKKPINYYTNFHVGGEFNGNETIFIRAGYSFTLKDADQFFTSDYTSDQDTYYKASWNSVSLGLGFKSEINTTDIRIDIGMDVRTKAFPPLFIFSGTVAF